MTCNPLCGRCKPPLEVALACPECEETIHVSRNICLHYLGYPYKGRAAFEASTGFELPECISCPSCGADLTPILRACVVPAKCLYSGIVCGYPCGRSKRERKEWDLVCEKQVPLSRLPSQEVKSHDARNREGHDA